MTTPTPTTLRSARSTCTWRQIRGSARCSSPSETASRSFRSKLFYDPSVRDLGDLMLRWTFVAVVVAGLIAIGTPMVSATAPTLTPAQQALDTQVVVLNGGQFPDWSAGPEVTARAPEVPTNYGVFDSQAATPAPLSSVCHQSTSKPDVNGSSDPNHGDHNCFQPNELPIRTVPGLTGVPPDSLRGYKWNGTRFVQIPFQVDTKWQHYISNDASGFAFYSGTDQETTYTFDREGFRYETNAPFDPTDPGIVCRALPVDGIVATPDPNPGLIDTDEMAFMASDAAGAAPSSAPLPAGIVGAKKVLIADPVTGITRYAYVMESAPAAGQNTKSWAVPIAYTATNSPYVRYQPDANADTLVYSQSSYGDYGNAAKGPVCTPDGQPVIGKGFKKLANGHLALDSSTYVQRRPLDTAAITTARYKFRYDGRSLMDDLQV